MPGLPYVIQETHQSTTRNKHTRATISANIKKKVIWFEKYHGIISATLTSGVFENFSGRTPCQLFHSLKFDWSQILKSKAQRESRRQHNL